MIIKFKSKDTWVIFGEVDHVEYRKVEFDLKHGGVSSDAIVYEPSDDQPAIEWIGMGFFTKNMNDATEIIACSPIYIMNDQGRTVETI